MLTCFRDQDNLKRAMSADIAIKLLQSSTGVQITRLAGQTCIRDKDIYQTAACLTICFA